MKYEITYIGISDIGNYRHVNQDNLVCERKHLKVNRRGKHHTLNGSFINTTPTLLGVFDGMGGEECGEMASTIAATTAAKLTLAGRASDDMLKLCRRANELICNYAEENDISSMGTTAAVLEFDENKITLFNIGDSKIFRISDNDMVQISEDHYGIVTPGHKPPLSQNLGIPEDELILQPYISQGNYTDGDMYLICSDGLTDMVKCSEIERIVRNNELNKAGEELIAAALNNGGKDNITVVLCSISGKRFKLFN